MANELSVELAGREDPGPGLWAAAMKQCLKITREIDPSCRHPATRNPLGWKPCDGGIWLELHPWPTEAEACASVVPMDSWTLFCWPHAELMTLGHPPRRDFGQTAWSFTIAPERGERVRGAELLAVALALGVAATRPGTKIHDGMAIWEKWDIPAADGDDPGLDLVVLHSRLRERVTSSI